MALKAKLSDSEFTKLPEATQALYKKVGEFHIIDIEGMDDPAALAKAYETTRTELKETGEQLKLARKDMKRFEGVDPDKFKEAVSQAASLEQKLAEVQSNQEKTLDNFRRVKDTELADAKTKLAAKTAHIRDAKVTGAINDALAAAKGKPKFLSHLIREHLNVEVVNDDADEIKITVMKDGQPRINDKNAKPFTLAELVEEFRADKEYAAAFEAPNASGGGSRAGVGLPVNGAVATPEQLNAMTPAQKISYGLKHGQLAGASQGPSNE